VAAIGGREAILAHTSTHALGTLAMPSTGLSGALEIFGAHPNKTLLKISLGGVGDVLEGFDGTHGWSLSPMTGPMLLEGKQLDEKRFDSEFYSELRSESRYASVTTLERVDFEGRPCYKVRLVRKSGGEDIEFYDVATGLKAGSTTSRETQMGTVTGTTIETRGSPVAVAVIVAPRRRARSVHPRGSHGGIEFPRPAPPRAGNPRARAPRRSRTSRVT
jgi:hypothetical protein